MIAATPGHRRLSALRSLLATLTLLAATLALGVVPARAEPSPTPPLLVALTGASASGTTPADTLVLSGTLTNTGDAPLTQVQARLWRSTLMLRTPLALDEALRGAPPAGRVLAAPTAVLSGHTPDVVAPGETVAFQLEASLRDLGFTNPGTTYWVGATVTAGRLEGSARTWFTVPGPDPVPVTPVVELAAAPRLVKPNLFVDDTLADELTGRLRVLLDAAAQPGVSRVVDPALVAEVTDMADGYRVIDGDSSVPGTRADVARAWLAELQALPAASGSTSLFGRPDLTRLFRVGGDRLVTDALRASEPSTAGTVVTLDRVNPEMLGVLSGYRTPVLATGTGLSVPWARVGGVGILTAVAPGSPVVAEDLPDTALNRAMVLQAYARAEGGQIRLLREAADVAADRAGTPPWATRRLLANVVATAPAEGDRTLAPDTSTQPRAGEEAGQLRALRDGVAAYGAAAPATGVGALADAHLARAASRAWAGHEADRAAWVGAVASRVGLPALESGLTVSALPRFTMTAASNEFPVTVTNTLPDDVVLRVVGASDSPQRIRLVASEPVTVKAGTSAGVVLRAEASGNGVADARIHAETGDGRRLTADVAVAVEATNLGTLGWVIVIVSGLVLVTSSALRIRQVRARNTGGGHAR